MPVTKWIPSAAGLAAATIDAVNPSTAYGVGGSGAVGLLYFGGGKARMHREIILWDLNDTPYSGAALTGEEVLTNAYFEFDTNTSIGIVGVPQAVVIDRITRDDWDYPTVTWNEYKAANAWTTVGGDIATPQLITTTPTAVPGDWVVQGALPLVIDAMTFRANRLHIRIKLSSEVDDGIDRYFSFTEINSRLCIEYAGGGQQSGGRRNVKPQYDHILDRRSEGRTIRELRAAERGLEEATRAVLV